MARSSSVSSSPTIAIKRTRQACQLSVDIQVRPASFRTIRGIKAIGAIADELAFWRSDDSANPDKEILKALRPSLATTGGPLIAISSPHAKRGELYGMFKRYYGPDDPLVLVWKAPTRTMNATVPQRVIDEAEERTRKRQASMRPSFGLTLRRLLIVRRSKLVSQPA